MASFLFANYKEELAHNWYHAVEQIAPRLAQQFFPDQAKRAEPNIIRAMTEYFKIGPGKSQIARMQSESIER